jgi:hypothetical protein
VDKSALLFPFYELNRFTSANQHSTIALYSSAAQQHLRCEVCGVRRLALSKKEVLLSSVFEMAFISETV